MIIIIEEKNCKYCEVIKKHLVKLLAEIQKDLRKLL